jgi:hypothetical protein
MSLRNLPHNDQIHSIAELLNATVHDRFPEHMSHNEVYELRLKDIADGKLTFGFEQYGKRDRIVILALFPADFEGNSAHGPKWFNSTITVGKSRPAAEIVTDVRRRLLADYPEALAEIRQRHEETKRRKEGDRQLVTELMSSAGITPDAESAERGRFSIYNNMTSQSADVRLLSQNSVHIDVRWVNAEKAKRILAILAE